MQANVLDAECVSLKQSQWRLLEKVHGAVFLHSVFGHYHWQLAATCVIAWSSWGGDTHSMDICGGFGHLDAISNRSLDDVLRVWSAVHVSLRPTLASFSSQSLWPLFSWLWVSLEEQYQARYWHSRECWFDSNELVHLLGLRSFFLLGFCVLPILFSSCSSRLSCLFPHVSSIQVGFLFLVSVPPDFDLTFRLLTSAKCLCDLCLSLPTALGSWISHLELSSKIARVQCRLPNLTWFQMVWATWCRIFQFQYCLRYSLPCPDGRFGLWCDGRASWTHHCWEPYSRIFKFGIDDFDGSC